MYGVASADRRLLVDDAKKCLQYLAGVSVRRVEDITETLWGTRVSPSTVSDFNKRIAAPFKQTHARSARKRGDRRVRRGFYVDVHKLAARAFRKKLTALVRIRPEWDVLPIRAPYDLRGR